VGGVYQNGCALGVHMFFQPYHFSCGLPIEMRCLPTPAGAAALGSALRALGSRGGPAPLRRLHLGSNGLDAGVTRALQAAALEVKGLTLVV
jgi:hypothetical protein